LRVGVIRPFRPEDAAALSELTVAAIAILGLHAYSARQVMAWAAGHLGPPLFLEQSEPGDVVLVSLSPEG